MSSTKSVGRKTGFIRTQVEPTRGLETVGPDYNSGMLPFREAGSNWSAHLFHFLGRLGRRELALIGPLISFTFISSQVLKTKMLSTSVACCVGAISLMVLIIGMTALVVEDKSNGKTRKERTNQTPELGDGGDGSLAS
jgi:hypothetical protein